MPQRIIIIAGALLALALHAGILISGAAAIRDRESAAMPDFVLETPAPGALEERRLPAEPAPTATEPMATAKTSRVRSVEPGLFAPPDDVLAQPLQRIAPRPPLSAPEKEQAPPVLTIRRPVALAAGLIRSGSTTLRLKEIEPERVEKVCEANGASWPCGMIARTAFRNFLQGRSLRCEEMEEQADGTLTGSCTVGGENAAEWLVTNGWAMALPGSALEAKADAARSARRGFFGGDPRDRSPAPAAIDNPPAAPPDEATSGL